MSSNIEIVDALTRQQILLQRRGTQIYKDLLPLLLEVQRKSAAIMASSPTDTFTNVRSQAIFAEIDKLISDLGITVTDKLYADLRELAEYEAGVTTTALSSVTKATFVAPTTAQIDAVMSNPVMRLVDERMGTTRALTVDNMVVNFSMSASKRIKAEIQKGIIEGASISNVVKSVDRIVDRKTRRELEAVIRTATNAISSEARKTVYDYNDDIIKGYRWVSTLDSRTTAVCRGRDGRFYEKGTQPTPPAHYNCRSVVVPVIEDKYSLSGGKTTRMARDPDTNKSQRVDGKATYNSWLKDQDTEFQDEVLGVRKAQLFRSGNLHLSKFTNDDGVSYTMAELKALYPKAWARAFGAKDISPITV